MTIAHQLPDDVRAALVAAEGLSTRRGLERIGVTRADLDSWCRLGIVERVTRGVYAAPLVDAKPEAVYRRFVLSVLAANNARSLVVTGPAAIVMHGLPLLGSSPGVVHAIAPHAHGRRLVDRVRVVGPADPDDFEQVGPWRVATPARAALDCARVFGVAAAVVAADAALRSGLATEADLVASCDRMAGKLGVARARRAVRLADGRSESPGESWSAVVFDGLGLAAPDRQHEVRDDQGLAGRTDFWWPGPRVVGEYDGRVKYGRANPSGRAPEEVLWEEKKREDRIRATGLKVVRWTTSELANPSRLARLLAPHMA